LSNHPQATILVVDDHPTNLGVLYDMLTKGGYRVLVAEGGPAALLRSQKGSPDLILLDAMMPDMDGFEVCKALKENPDTADIPVVFVTALTDVESKNRAFNLGAVDFISKPIQRKATLACVERCLKRRKHKASPQSDPAVTTIDINSASVKSASENGPLLSAVIHDLRGSLGGALGLLEGVQDDLKDSTDVESIADSCNWLRRSLISIDEAIHVLTLRRSLLSDYQTKLKACDLLKTLKSAAERATEVIRIPAIRVQAAEDLPGVTVDTFLLEEFFFLLMRAMSASLLDDSELLVSASGTRTKQAEVNLFLDVPGRPLSSEECHDFFKSMAKGHYRRIRGVGISLISLEQMVPLLDVAVAVEPLASGNRFSLLFPPKSKS
jgi:CheY-like chemotaxis protein